MKRITIDPITRLEGHGKIEIFLNDEGNVENAYLQIPELRGFEQFSVGRPAEEMPRITNRICGVCPEAHHMAGTKALDASSASSQPRWSRKSARCSTRPSTAQITPCTFTPWVAPTSCWALMPRQQKGISWA